MWVYSLICRLLSSLMYTSQSKKAKLLLLTSSRVNLMLLSEGVQDSAFYFFHVDVDHIGHTGEPTAMLLSVESPYTRVVSINLTTKQKKKGRGKQYKDLLLWGGKMFFKLCNIVFEHKRKLTNCHCKTYTESGQSAGIGCSPP